MTPQEALLALTDFLADNAAALLPVVFLPDPTLQGDPASYPDGWAYLSEWNFGREGNDGSSTFGIAKSYYRTHDTATLTVVTPKSRGVGAPWLAAAAAEALLLEREIGELQVVATSSASTPPEPDDSHVAVDVVLTCTRERFFP